MWLLHARIRRVAPARPVPRTRTVTAARAPLRWPTACRRPPSPLA